MNIFVQQSLSFLLNFSIKRYEVFLVSYVHLLPNCFPEPMLLLNKIMRMSINQTLTCNNYYSSKMSPNVWVSNGISL